MLLRNVLLMTASVIVVAAMWSAKYFYPTKVFPNINVLYIYTAGTIIAATLIYYGINVNDNVCSPDDPGVCHSNSHCGNGVCVKAGGMCQCKCNDGFFGDKCQHIKWNSVHCMGPNTQWKARKGENDMCICPNGQWQDGITKKYGYVQCLRCAGDYGPLAGEAPCTYKWGTATYLTNDCYHQNTDEVCNEFKHLTIYDGPNNEKGYATPTALCESSYCRCNSTRSSHISAHVNATNTSNRSVCQVTGYLDPTIPSLQTCDSANNTRKCSSYNCK